MVAFIVHGSVEVIMKIIGTISTEKSTRSGGVVFSEKVNDYAKNITNKLIDHDIRAMLDDRSDKVGAKIRKAEINRINVMLIVGPKEQENNTVSVRRKFSGDLGTVDQDILLSTLVNEIKDRSLTHS